MFPSHDQKEEAKDEEQNTVVEEQSIEEPIQEEPTKQEPAELTKEQVSEEDASREKEDSEEGPSTKALRGYSKRQKRKMEKMLARLKDMEEYADSITKERDKLKDQLSSVGKGYVSEFEGRVTSAVEAAKSKLKKAIEDNDTEAQVTAQEQLAQAKADSVRLANLRANQKREEEAYKVNQGQQTQQPQYQPRDYKAEAWAANNT